MPIPRGVAEQRKHMQVRIDDSRDDRAAFQIDRARDRQDRAVFIRLPDSAVCSGSSIWSHNTMAPVLPIRGRRWYGQRYCLR